jgi:hypothetical protein
MSPRILLRDSPSELELTSPNRVKLDGLFLPHGTYSAFRAWNSSINVSTFNFSSAHSVVRHWALGRRGETNKLGAGENVGTRHFVHAAVGGSDHPTCMYSLEDQAQTASRVERNKKRIVKTRCPGAGRVVLYCTSSQLEAARCVW